MKFFLFNFFFKFRKWLRKIKTSQVVFSSSLLVAINFGWMEDEFCSSSRWRDSFMWRFGGDFSCDVHHLTRPPPPSNLLQPPIGRLIKKERKSFLLPLKKKKKNKVSYRRGENKKWYFTVKLIAPLTQVGIFPLTFFFNLFSTRSSSTTFFWMKLVKMMTEFSALSQ